MEGAEFKEFITTSLFQNSLKQLGNRLGVETRTEELA